MAAAISGGNSSSFSSSSSPSGSDGRSPTASFFGNSDLSTSRALASSTFLAGDEPIVILPSFSLPEPLELTSGSFGPFRTGMDAVVPLRLATMLHRRRQGGGRDGGGRSGGGGRGGGDGRVTSGRRARSAESVAPIPGMVDDNIQGRRL
jgi:GINS complex subunit 2